MQLNLLYYEVYYKLEEKCKEFVFLFLDGFSETCAVI